MPQPLFLGKIEGMGISEIRIAWLPTGCGVFRLTRTPQGPAFLSPMPGLACITDELQSNSWDFRSIWAEVAPWFGLHGGSEGLIRSTAARREGWSLRYLTAEPVDPQMITGLWTSPEKWRRHRTIRLAKVPDAVTRQAEAED